MQRWSTLQSWKPNSFGIYEFSQGEKRIVADRDADGFCVRVMSALIGSLGLDSASSASGLRMQQEINSQREFAHRKNLCARPLGWTNG
jgi:hypothetical protein